MENVFFWDISPQTTKALIGPIGFRYEQDITRIEINHDGSKFIRGNSDETWEVRNGEDGKCFHICNANNSTNFVRKTDYSNRIRSRIGRQIILDGIIYGTCEEDLYSFGNENVYFTNKMKSCRIIIRGSSGEENNL